MAAKDHGGAAGVGWFRSILVNFWMALVLLGWCPSVVFGETEKNTASEEISLAVDFVASLVDQWSGLEQTLRATITRLQAEKAVLEGTSGVLRGQVIELETQLQKEAKEKVTLQSELQECRRQVTVASAFEQECEQLRDRLQQMGAELARANRATERFQEQYREAELRRHTLALAVESGRGLEELQSQLVTALELLERERRRSNRLGALLSQIGSATVDETLAREIELALGAVPAAAKDAEAAAESSALRVISFSPELGLIGIQGGMDQGLVLGALVSVERDGRILARARIVDLREHVAGALIEPEDGLMGEPRVGDPVRFR